MDVNPCLLPLTGPLALFPRLAGKTTLMDCVAGRKTVGLIKGEITVNGHEKEQATW